MDEVLLDNNDVKELIYGIYFLKEIYKNFWVIGSYYNPKKWEEIKKNLLKHIQLRKEAVITWEANEVIASTNYIKYDKDTVYQLIKIFLILMKDILVTFPIYQDKLVLDMIRKTYSIYMKSKIFTLEKTIIDCGIRSLVQILLTLEPKYNQLRYFVNYIIISILRRNKVNYSAFFSTLKDNDRQEHLYYFLIDSEKYNFSRFTGYTIRNNDDVFLIKRHIAELRKYFEFSNLDTVIKSMEL